MSDHVIAAGRDYDARVDVGSQRIEVTQPIVTEYLFESGSIQVQPGCLHVGEHADLLHSRNRFRTLKAGVHDVRAGGREGLLAV